ncbi:MAG: hypothetical protein ACP5JU_03840, partial [Minisyncoccia bacterium]
SNNYFGNRIFICIIFENVYPVLNLKIVIFKRNKNIGIFNSKPLVILSLMLIDIFILKIGNF